MQGAASLMGGERYEESMARVLAAVPPVQDCATAGMSQPNLLSTIMESQLVTLSTSVSF
jgi:hypothetical protein